ncbi:porphobilinogen deaminase [Plasmodium sp. gorilla clade G2]|uniref:porphobilinogen deaminase n=1 Tax=Plasmodium sp. gorilla clade G2 TaxID=880535 RepID=UPI000D22015C|nr:porphobilinogen deaminase [Plasmodium sp. gorilla clade G2]SOV16615.1 porphobilinogen deaminase [Plasmodium sp. gorilla clade G2]
MYLLSFLSFIIFFIFCTAKRHEHLIKKCFLNSHNFCKIKTDPFRKKNLTEGLYSSYANKNEIIIGTRDSPLALKQSEKVRKRLMSYFKKMNKNINITFKYIKTTGDNILDNKSVGLYGGKGIFTKELDEQLINGNVDLCVHSLKDVPILLPDDIELSCFLKRDTINDAFLSIKYKSINDLNMIKSVSIIEDISINKKENDHNNDTLCTIGTSSLRRRSQIKKGYKNIYVKNIRGNINTRIEKLYNGEVDALIIAMCGIERLIKKTNLKNILKNKEQKNIYKPFLLKCNNKKCVDLCHVNIQKLNKKVIYPALCQGIIAVTSNRKNDFISNLLKNINNKKSEMMAEIERSFLYHIDGNCMMPIGGYTKIRNQDIYLNVIINDIHGYNKYQVKQKGTIYNYKEIGPNAAIKIKEIIGTEKFKKIKAEAEWHLLNNK